MNIDKKNKILDWMRYAQDDLIASEHFYKTMEFPIYRVVCFNAQQSVEKYLKAYQLFHDIEIIKTHNLSTLILSLKDFDTQIINFENKCNLLNGYAVQYKYPDDFEDLTNDDAIESIEIAKKIEKFIKSKIVLQ